MWTNGEQISHYHRKDPNYFEDITDIPKGEQRLEDILSERFTLKNLIIKDKIANEFKGLKGISSPKLKKKPTASIGGVSFGNRIPAEDAKKQADDAMYEAKDGGRNRVAWRDPR